MLDRLIEQPRKTLVAGLGAVVAALAAVNIYVARTPVDISPVASTGAPPSAAAKSAEAPLKTPLDTRPVGSFPETVARPIFNGARKPVERQQALGPAISGPEDLRLVGILQTASGTKRALVRAGEEAKGTWLVEGSAVSGWTVKSIGPRSIIVGNGGRDYEIVISKGASR